MNSVCMVGRLVYEPEIKQTPNGFNIISTRIAVSRNDKNRATDFFTVRILGKTAEFVANHFHKGDPIAIMGKLQTDQYERQDGTKVTDTYIFVTEVNFVEQKAKSEAAPAESQEAGAVQTKSDLPFEI